MVWTQHKSLAYLRSAKGLNSRQVRWALFLGRFGFALTYRPRSKNIKPDALSRQFTVDQTDSVPVPCDTRRFIAAFLCLPVERPLIGLL